MYIEVTPNVEQNVKGRVDHITWRFLQKVSLYRVSPLIKAHSHNMAAKVTKLFLVWTLPSKQPILRWIHCHCRTIWTYWNQCNPLLTSITIVVVLCDWPLTYAFSPFHEATIKYKKKFGLISCFHGSDCRLYFGRNQQWFVLPKIMQALGSNVLNWDIKPPIKNIDWLLKVPIYANILTQRIVFRHRLFPSQTY